MASLLRLNPALRGAALALAAGGMLAACSVDGALMLDDMPSVGSITPPAAVGTSGFGYAGTAGRQAAPQRMARLSSGTNTARASAADFPAASTTSMGQSASQDAAISASSGEVASADDSAGTDVGQPGMVSIMDNDRVVEGDTRDPVVAGIGTSHPVAVTGDGSQMRTVQAADGSQTEIYMGPPGRGAPPRPLSLPPGGLEASDAGSAGDGAAAGVQVAALPRPVDPLPRTSDAYPEPAMPAPAPAPQAVAPAPAPVPQAVEPAPQSTWRDAGSGGMPASEVACRRELKRLGVVYTDIPRISHGQACGIDWPIKVTGLSGGIRIKPAATLNCQVTAEFAKWVKSDLAPAARMRYLSGIASITQLSSYSCRTMNSQRGAPMSEHAHGNAIDIGAITLNSGRRIDVRKPGWFAFRQRGFLNTVRAESCDNFTTVLGPGTNKYHWNHFHFDLRQRKSGRSYCE